MNYIKPSKISSFGSWNLADFNIDDALIPTNRIVDLQISSASSVGALKKFNINHKKAGILYVKSGYSPGGMYQIIQPITERICYGIGNLLGFDVIAYKLWSVDANLFRDIEGLEENSESDGDFSPSTPQQNRSFQRVLFDNKRVLCSVSKSFIEGDEVFHSCNKLFPSHKSKELYTTLVSSLDTEDKKKLDQMIVFDYLVHNTDRHKKNFGYVQDVNGNMRFAPLFDHGLALLSDLHDSEIEENGADCIGFALGKPFGNLGSALELVDKSSMEGIKLDTDISEILKVYEVYEGLFHSTRVEVVKSMLERKWAYVQKVLS